MRAESVITIVPRWSLKLANLWGGAAIQLPSTRWKNILTDDTFPGGRTPLQTIFQRFPVALLVKEEG
jgi:(1->4)-alpha-D-glucan 1-alpha-D-glucosylmutase